MQVLSSDLLNPDEQAHADLRRQANGLLRALWHSGEPLSFCFFARFAEVSYFILPKLNCGKSPLTLAYDLSQRSLNAHAIGFRLQRVVLDHGHAAAEWILDATGFLLQYMPQLMAQEFLSL